MNATMFSIYDAAEVSEDFHHVIRPSQTFYSGIGEGPINKVQNTLRVNQSAKS